MELHQHLTHVDEICHQTEGKHINTIKRINQQLEKVYHWLFTIATGIAIFNFCSVIWIFANTFILDKIEWTNKMALRFVTNKNHSSYKEICKEEKQLGIYTKIALRIWQSECIKFRGTLHRIILVNSSDLTIWDMKWEIIQGWCYQNSIQPDMVKNNFSYLGGQIWNSIPVTIKKECLTQLLQISPDRMATDMWWEWSYAICPYHSQSLWCYSELMMFQRKIFIGLHGVLPWITLIRLIIFSNVEDCINHRHFDLAAIWIWTNVLKGWLCPFKLGQFCTNFDIRIIPITSIYLGILVNVDITMNSVLNFIISFFLLSHTKVQYL